MTEARRAVRGREIFSSSLFFLLLDAKKSVSRRTRSCHTKGSSYTTQSQTRTGNDDRDIGLSSTPFLRQLPVNTPDAP